MAILMQVATLKISLWTEMLNGFVSDFSESF